MNKKIMAKIGTIALFFSMFGGYPQALAATQGAVLINEVAWAGSIDSANDEWIELYNTTDAPIDLSGWQIKDDGATSYKIGSGVIPAKGYFLIEDSENAVSNIQANLVVNLSLANSGDSLQLLDGAGQLVDTVNGAGAAWYAGSSSTYATMERKVAGNGDMEANFVDSSGSGALASKGGIVIGTPKALNSSSVPAVNSQIVKLKLSNLKPLINDQVVVTAEVQNIQNLFTYGVEINYDPAVLEFLNATKKNFLGANGTVQTSFQSGLKNGKAGDLLVAEARTIDPKVGVNGNGDLFELTFKVKAEASAHNNFSFMDGSFAASNLIDLPVQFQNASFTPVQPVGAIEPVAAINIKEGNSRYSLNLHWTESLSNPEKYRIERKDAHGNWTVIGELAGTDYVDDDLKVNGGKLIPNHKYFYRVSAIKNNATSVPVEIQGVEGRGIKGDINRSDLVDGRDLEALAKHFAENDSMSTFDKLIDTTYDGIIDGSDLIDIGANFATTYK